MASDKVIASPTDIRAARQAAGLSQTAAGALCHRSLRAWQAVEAGDRTLDPAAWELFLLRTGQHPTYRLLSVMPRRLTVAPPESAVAPAARA